MAVFEAMFTKKLNSLFSKNIYNKQKYHKIWPYESVFSNYQLYFSLFRFLL